MKSHKKRRYIIVITIIAVAFIFFAAGLYNEPCVSEYELSFDNLPGEWDGLRIALITDTHLMNSDENNDTVLELVKDADPDMIFLVGDIYDIKARMTGVPVFVRNLKDIAPVYSASGNHERWSYFYTQLQDWYSAAGVRPLENAGISIGLGGGRANIYGIIDPGDRREDIVVDSVDYIGVPDNRDFNILLFHRADMLDVFEGLSYDLIFSGHIHGGQIRLPFAGGFMAEYGGLFPKYSGGIYSIGSTYAVVGRGIANERVIPRFYNRPEVIVVTLWKGPSE